MTSDEKPDPRDPLSRLRGEVSRRLRELTHEERGGYVGSDLCAVDRVLSQVRSENLARGPVFCEWGSGLGGVCGVATFHGFEPLGIEIERTLVDSARSLARDLELAMVFAQGTFLLPGDEDLATDVAAPHTRRDFGNRAWDEIDLRPDGCDVVFAYPWPGEEAFVDRVFARHASADTLLLTFHDFDRVLVQRKRAQEAELSSLGWM